MFRKSLPILFAIIFAIPAYAVANTTTIPHPFVFTENKGQWDARVLYKCNARNGMTWFLERDGITLLTMVPDKTKPPILDPMDARLPELMRRHPPRYPMKSNTLMFRRMGRGIRRLMVERDTIGSIDPPCLYP